MRWVTIIAGLLTATILASGCRSIRSKDKEVVASGTVYTDLRISPASDESGEQIVMRPGDEIVINFAQPSGREIPFIGKIQNDGTVTLLSNKVFIAAGKTAPEFQKEVSNYYGSNFCPITVTDPAPILVFGEVKAPGKRPFSGALTVLKAIESTGGFTKRANPRHVKLVRSDGRQYVVNCINARMDLQVYPDDRIVVPSGRPSW
jgi:protein involved in polysaccharide export with SLBB domain